MYNSLEPIDKFLHTGMLMSAIYNTALTKKQGMWLSAKDFMPKYISNIEKQSIKEMKAVMMGMVKSGRAKVVSKEDKNA